MSSQILPGLSLSRSRWFLASQFVRSPTGCQPTRSATCQLDSSVQVFDGQRGTDEVTTATGTGGGLIRCWPEPLRGGTTGNQLVKIRRRHTRPALSVHNHRLQRSPSRPTEASMSPVWAALFVAGTEIHFTLLSRQTRRAALASI
jgi:hypothetical protein